MMIKNHQKMKFFDFLTQRVTLRASALISTLQCQTKAPTQPTKWNFGQKFTKSCAYAHYAPLDPMVT